MEGAREFARGETRDSGKTGALRRYVQRFLGIINLNRLPVPGGLERTNRNAMVVALEPKSNCLLQSALATGATR